MTNLTVIAEPIETIDLELAEEILNTLDQFIVMARDEIAAGKLSQDTIKSLAYLQAAE